MPAAGVAFAGIVFSLSFAFGSSECGSASSSSAWFGGMFIPGIPGIAPLIPPAVGAAVMAGAAARSAP